MLLIFESLFIFFSEKAAANVYFYESKVNAIQVYNTRHKQGYQ